MIGNTTNVVKVAARAIATVFAIALLVGCETTHKRVPELEQIRSEVQTLILENSGTETLLIMAQDRSDDRNPLQIPPSGAARITFSVLTVVELELREGRTRYEIVAGTERNLIESTDPPGYVGQPDLDATLRVGVSGHTDPPDERRYTLNDCRNGGWHTRAAAAQEHRIDISNPPLPGIPSRICPK